MRERQKTMCAREEEPNDLSRRPRRGFRRFLLHANVLERPAASAGAADPMRSSFVADGNAAGVKRRRGREVASCLDITTRRYLDNLQNLSLSPPFCHPRQIVVGYGAASGPRGGAAADPPRRRAQKQFAQIGIAVVSFEPLREVRGDAYKQYMGHLTCPFAVDLEKRREYGRLQFILRAGYIAPNAADIFEKLPNGTIIYLIRDSMMCHQGSTFCASWCLRRRSRKSPAKELVPQRVLLALWISSILEEEFSK